MLGTNRITDLDELILMDDKHEVIVDVGGNKTSSLVLDEIKKLEVLEMLSGLFLWEMVNLMGKMQLQLWKKLEK